MFGEELGPGCTEELFYSMYIDNGESHDPTEELIGTPWLPAKNGQWRQRGKWGSGKRLSSRGRREAGLGWGRWKRRLDLDSGCQGHLLKVWMWNGGNRHRG